MCLGSVCGWWGGGRATDGGRSGFSLAIANGLGEEAQVLVDFQAILQPQDLLLVVLENGQGIAEQHLWGKVGLRWAGAGNP